MDTSDTLLAYSEWLDGEGLILGPEVSGDDRDHATLACEFIEQWESHPNRGTLAGREESRG